MKSITAMLVLLSSLSVAAADTGACYSISDADVRNFCIAKAKNDRSVCYTIQRADMRAQCLAEVG